jgi:hypothetical protein
MRNGAGHGFALEELCDLLARGYLRLLTARSGPGLHPPTCLRDTAPKILDSPLDVSPHESDEWCVSQALRRPKCPAP